jgi:hypothetical protein
LEYSFDKKVNVGIVYGVFTQRAKNMFILGSKRTAKKKAVVPLPATECKK